MSARIYTTCPKCGEELSFYDGEEVVECPHCGAKYVYECDCYLKEVV